MVGKVLVGVAVAAGAVAIAGTIFDKQIDGALKKAGVDVKKWDVKKPDTEDIKRAWKGLFRGK
jgi:uncharacterized protein YdgA (DUF945 family)